MKSAESRAWERFLIIEAKNPETPDADEFNEAEADAEVEKVDVAKEEKKDEEVTEKKVCEEADDVRVAYVETPGGDTELTLKGDFDTNDFVANVMTNAFDEMKKKDRAQYGSVNFYFKEACEEASKVGKGMTVGQFITALNKCDKNALIQFDDREHDNQVLNYVADINDKAVDDKGNKTCVVGLEYYDFVMEKAKKPTCEAKAISQQDLIDGLTNLQADFESASHGNKDTHKRIMRLFDDLIGEIETYGGLN